MGVPIDWMATQNDATKSYTVYTNCEDMFMCRDWILGYELFVGGIIVLSLCCDKLVPDFIPPHSASCLHIRLHCDSIVTRTEERSRPSP